MGLTEDRIQLYKDTVEFKKTDRIPLQSGCYLWTIFDAGYKLEDALYDWDKMLKVICEHIERYNFDALGYLGTRNLFTIVDPIDANRYILDKERQAISVDDESVMLEDEYGEFIEDRAKFTWEKMLARKARSFNVDNLRKSAMAYRDFIEYMGKLNKKMKEYGTLKRASDRYMQVPSDYFFEFYRGMKNFGIDMRRRFDKVKEACDVIWSEDPASKSFDDYFSKMKPNTNAAYDFGLIGISQNILNMKQFDKLYWPYIKNVFASAEKYNKKVDYFIEGEMMRFADYFSDIPKGVLNMQLEQDDIFEMRKKLPNISLSGGMPTTILGHGTKEQCVDYAKKLANELACYGGYVFNTDKMLCYQNDCKRENLLAILEYFRQL